MANQSGMNIIQLRSILMELTDLIPELPVLLITEALYIIIIAGAKNSGVPVRAARDAIKILKEYAYSFNYKDSDAIMDLQSLQKGD